MVITRKHTQMKFTCLINEGEMVKVFGTSNKRSVMFLLNCNGISIQVSLLSTQLHQHFLILSDYIKSLHIVNMSLQNNGWTFYNFLMCDTNPFQQFQRVSND